MDVATAMAGGGAAKLGGAAIAKIAPKVARLAEPAIAGAVTSGLQGGDAKQNTVAGLIGLVLGVPGAVVEGAPARVRARALTDVVQGEGEGAKPTKSLVRKLAARAGEEGQNLGQVFDEDPALEHVMSTAAARYPKEALDAVQQTIERNDTLNGPVYQAITDAGGVKLTDVIGPMQKLQDGYYASGKTAEAAAVGREIKSLVENYGGKEAENAVLTGKQLQGLRNQIGHAAFETTPFASQSLKGPVKRDLYGAYRDGIEGAAGQLEDLAPGVSLDNFRARNKTTSVLIPMRDVLKDRLASEQTGAASLVERFREAAKEGDKGPLAMITSRLAPPAMRLAGQAGRHVDFALANLAREMPPAVSAVSSVARSEAAAQAGQKAPAGRLVNGVRLFGRPATAEERTAAGLPASLEHAINTNDPTLGHAALRHEVFGQ